MTPSRFPDMPPQVAALATESRGFPVPYFVPILNGQPDFRAVDPRTIEQTHKKRLCWICGLGLGSFGPMKLVPAE